MRLAGCVVILVGVLAGLSGCSSQALYASGQGWQKEQCLKLMDAQERGRCLDRLKMPHDEYQRQSGAVGGHGE